MEYTFLLLFLSLILIAAFLTRLLYNPTPPLPPGPKPIPLLGNIHTFPKTKPWFHLYNLSKTHGPVMHFNFTPAGQSVIILSSQKAAHDLLNRRSAKYSHRPRLVMAGDIVTRGMHMLLRSYDDTYRVHQKMGAPLLSARAAERYRPLQEVEAQQVLFDILSGIGSDKVGERGVDFNHHFERAMASTVYCLIYGYRLRTGHEAEFLSAKRVMAEFANTSRVGAYLVDSFPVLNYLPRFVAPWKKEGEELYELERALHMGNLKRGLESKRWNFTKYMAGLPEAKGMSTEELAFDLGILADAGLDTSTVALDWFIVAWVTSGQSGWVRRAQEILDEVVGRQRLPDFGDRPRLAYIDAIVNEVLRWRPVGAGGVPHFTKTEDEYMGYRIPANSTVIPNHFAITRDEEIFGPDAERFIPERWLVNPNPNHDTPLENSEEKENIDISGMNLSALKDLPQTGFGFGRRICTGRLIARNSLFIQMARLLWAFDIEADIGLDEQGKRYPVDNLDSTGGIVTPPKIFRALMRPRGEWVTEVVFGRGSTHAVDHGEILEAARVR